ncbi:Beclin-1 [Camelus dromedarius]|uniref:Beclin-1 n=1 Tax=Camelus dromedarius TaxID=9838 RepID=A0A5N4C5J6_CAMDR|nr:Beclin-1 [Camelus dromedarius]
MAVLEAPLPGRPKATMPLRLTGPGGLRQPAVPCSQPLKLDTSLKILDRVIQELTAPLLATAQVKPGETQEEEANSGKEPCIETHQDGVSRRFIPPARMTSTESANSFTLIREASDGGTMENLS